MSTKERPILFSGPMVRAILEGKKTQTRRVVKPQPPAGYRQWGRVISDHVAFTNHPLQGEKGDVIGARCPYGQDSDRLWLRESMRMDNEGTWLYSADNEPAGCDMEDDHLMIPWVMGKQTEHCPSIHMPHWASRITLEVISVRVERIQDITPADMQAEGIDCLYDGDQINEHYTRQAWVNLWDGINAARGYSWESNPFVWRVEFRKVRP